MAVSDPTLSLAEIARRNGVATPTVHESLNKPNAVNAIAQRRAETLDKASTLGKWSRKMTLAAARESHEWSSETRFQLGLAGMKVAYEHGDTGDDTLDLAGVNATRRSKLALHMRYALRSPAAAQRLLRRMGETLSLLGDDPAAPG